MIQLQSIVEPLARDSTFGAAQLDKLRVEAVHIDALPDNDKTVAQRAAWFDRLRSALAARSLSPEVVDALKVAYRDEPAVGKVQVARLLASADGSNALSAFVEIMLTTSPDRPHNVLLAFSPLFQRQSYDPAALFPRLLGGIENPLLASVVLEFANFLFRQKRVSRHPAASRTSQLAMLLGEVVQRLQQLEERPDSFASSPQQLSQLVGETVALVVTLCDALALIGDESIVGKLHQALELSHRRVRTEAAAALARLNDPRGATALAELAATPAVRQRALAYLDELGLIDRAAEEHRSAQARAEGELAAWLAMPTQFGAPPSAMTLVDERRLLWPGYNDAIECRLFDFEYRLPKGSFSSVAIVGPVTHAFMVDLEDLPPSDIYALYAGWHAEHEEITEQAADEISPSQVAAWKSIATELQSAGYSDLRLEKVGRFFETIDWVATTVRDGRRGIVVVSDDRAAWYVLGAGPRAPGPREIYWIDKGRRLLAAFNPHWQTSRVDEKPDDE